MKTLRNEKIMYKIECITRLTPYINKLISYVKTKGIEFFPKDGDMENVIFRRGEKELKIAYIFFYRFSGISAIHREKDQNQVEIVTVTDEMFVNNYLKTLVDFHFN